MFVENVRKKTAKRMFNLSFVVGFNIRKYLWIFENFNTRNKCAYLFYAGVSSCRLAMWLKVT